MGQLKFHCSICAILHSYTTNDKRLALQLAPVAFPASVAGNITQQVRSGQKSSVL